MTTRRIIAFIVFYIGIVLSILFMFFYVQDRYGHNPPRYKSDKGALYQFHTGNITQQQDNGMKVFSSLSISFPGNREYGCL